MKNLIKISKAVLLSTVCSTILIAGPMDDLKTAVESSDWSAAKSLAESITEADTGNGEAFFLLGKALSKLKENKAAVTALEKANKLVSDNADYRAEFGYALISRGQEMNMFSAGRVFMRALDQYKAAVRIDPDHLGAHIGLSRYYMNAPAIGGGSMKKAKVHAGEIARINPYLGHVEHALIAQKEGDDKAAETSFEAASKLNGKVAWIHFELGKLRQSTGEIEAARAFFEKALEINPEHAGAQQALTNLE